MKSEIQHECLTQPNVSQSISPVINNILITGDDQPFEILNSVQFHERTPAYTKLPDFFDAESLVSYVGRDTFPIPRTEDREGYHGGRHYDWWLSGLRDYLNIQQKANENGIPSASIGKVFELGCASGRVLRHFVSHRPDIEAWGADISLRHVEWIRLFLPSHVRIFQNSVLPNLPLESNYFDVISAFSVFTHVDELELAWLAELRRILRPGGIAYITFHSEKTWASMQPNWPIYQALLGMKDKLIGRSFDLKMLANGLPQQKTVFKWATSNTYNTNVFHHTDYIYNAWGRFFKVIEICEKMHDYQDVVILRK